MRVLIEGTNTPTIYKFDGQSATLRIEAIKGFTTFNGQMVPPSGGSSKDFYLEVPLTVENEQLTIPTFEIDSTEDAYPWDSAVTGDVPGYRAWIIIGNNGNGRKIPFYPKFKVPTLADGDPSMQWDEIRLYNRTFTPRFTQLDRHINVNEVQEWIQNAVGELNKASETNLGVTALDTDPSDPTYPIAVGVNSPLLGGDIGVINVLNFGIFNDAGVIEDAIVSLGSPNTLTSAIGGLDDSLIDKTVAIAGAGVSGATLITTITAVPDANTLSFEDAATTAVTGSRAVYGTDNSTAFQIALNTAAVSEDTRIVYVPAGNYLFASGSLEVPQGVKIQGSWDFAPDHLGYRYSNEVKPMDGAGTTFVVVVDEGENTGSFIFLNSESSVRGVCIFHPSQLSTLTTPKLYPWAIEMFGTGPTVENVELVNPYQGIYSHVGQRHMVRNARGLPLLTGLYVSQQLDTSRYEDITWFPAYTFSATEAPPYPLSNLFAWVQQNGTAYKFGRVDNGVAYNCFVYGYRTGFKFVVDAAESTTYANGSGAPGGKAWAELTDCGADTCSYPVDVDDVQGHDSTSAAGVTFTNCMFASAQWPPAFGGGHPLYSVWCRSTMTGRVGLVNCRFHLANRCIRHEAARLDVIGCYFQTWSVNAVSLGDGGVSTFTGNHFKMGSAQPVVLIEGSPWTAWAGNMFEYSDAGATVWSLSATANFNESGNSYATSPILIVVGGGGSAPAFQNSWVNFGGGYETAAFIKKDGKVTLRGVVRDGTIGLGTPAFTLPVGYRPATNVLFPVYSNGIFGGVQIGSGGEVSILVGDNASVSLNGIEFPVR